MHFKANVASFHRELFSYYTKSLHRELFSDYTNRREAVAPKGVPRNAEELEFEKSEKGLGKAAAAAAAACISRVFARF
jgi:hypothetical protein